jgi:hypothetical protein
MTYTYGIGQTYQTFNYDWIVVVGKEHIESNDFKKISDITTVFFQAVFKDDNIGRKNKELLDEIVSKLNKQEIKITDLEKMFPKADKVSFYPDLVI